MDFGYGMTESIEFFLKKVCKNLDPFQDCLIIQWFNIQDAAG
jgi:hypothetical protein